MSQHLFKLLGRAGVYLEENKGDGTDLPGGKTAEELAAEKALTDRAAADKKAADDKAAADALAAKGDTHDNGTKPSDAEAKLLKEVMALKEKQRVADAELKAFKDAAGESKPEDLKALIDAKKEADKLALEKRGEYDRILEQVKTEHTTVVTGLELKVKELTDLLAAKDTTLFDLTVGRAFTESAFIRDKSLVPASLARKEFGGHVDIVDGVAVVYDKPRGATERTPLVNADGKPKSFEEGIQVLYTSHPDSAALIRAGGKPGAGSTTVDTGKKPEDQSKVVQPGASRIALGLSKKNP